MGGLGRSVCRAPEGRAADLAALAPSAPYPVAAEQERQLLAISPRQLERRVHAHKQRVKRRVYGTTGPGSLLKHMIPIKTEQWDVTQAGYLDIDLVSHAGANADGEYLYTLDAVDIHTGWVERQAVRGKGQHGMLTALQAIARQLPCALRGIDSDNVLHAGVKSHKRKNLRSAALGSCETIPLLPSQWASSF